MILTCIWLLFIIYSSLEVLPNNNSTDFEIKCNRNLFDVSHANKLLSYNDGICVLPDENILSDSPNSVDYNQK